MVWFLHLILMLNIIKRDIQYSYGTMTSSRLEKDMPATMKFHQKIIEMGRTGRILIEGDYFDGSNLNYEFVTNF